MTTWLEKTADTFGRAVGAFQKGVAQTTAQVARVARRAFLTAWAESAKWAGGDYSRKGSQERAMQNTWVFTAVDKWMSLGGSSLIRIVESNDVDVDPVQVPNHHFEKLMRRPNPEMGGAFVRQYTFGWLALDGNAYWFIDVGEDGLPCGIWPLPANSTMPWTGTDNSSRMVEYYIYSVNGREYHIPPEYIVHFKLPNPFDIFRGLSRLLAAMLAVDADTAMAWWNGKFFSVNNTMPSAIINIKPHEEQLDSANADANALKEDLRSEYAAANRKTAITTGQDLKVELLGWNQRDMDFLGGRQFTKEEIWLAFGILAGMMDKNSTEANATVAERIFLEHTIYPLHVLMAEQLTAQCIIIYYGEDYAAQFDDIRPANVALMLQQDAASADVLTIDERRRKFWKEPELPHGRGTKTRLEMSTAAAHTFTPLPAPNASTTTPAITTSAAQTETISNVALNGAQVNAAMEIVMQVNSGALPRDVGLSALQTMFGLTEPQAQELLGGSSKKAIAEDLRKWRRKAVARFKEHGSGYCEFADTVIDTITYQAIATALFESESLDEVKGVFDVVLETMPTIIEGKATTIKAVSPDDRPWTPFEQEFYHALRRVLEGEAQQLADDVEKDGADILTDDAFFEAHKGRLLDAITNTLESLAAFGARAALQALGSDAPITLNWGLVNQNAANWARDYAAEMVSNVTDTTKDALRKIHAAWIEAGEGLPVLVKRIRELKNDGGTPIFNSVRAQLIAQTESTTIYANANAQAWQAAGLPRVVFKPAGHIGCRCYTQPYKLANGEWVVVWFTAQDDLVCRQPITTPWGIVKGCRALADVVISEGTYLGKKLSDVR